MNNLEELTNREYLNSGTEIQGGRDVEEGWRKAGRGTWKRDFSDTSSCKICDRIYVLFVRTTMRIEGEYRSFGVSRIIHIKVLLDKNMRDRGEGSEEEKKKRIYISFTSEKEDCISFTYKSFGFNGNDRPHQYA